MLISLFRFVFDSVYTYSAWLVVLLSVERVIVICLPLRARVLCSRRAAIISVSVLPVVIAAVYTYNIFSWEIDQNNKCNIREKYNFWISNVHPWITGEPQNTKHDNLLKLYLPLFKLF